MPTTLLAILDGVGINPNSRANSVELANTPELDRLWSEAPNATLTTHGTVVGLPKGEMGNSEVGHLHIGAGRTIAQWLPRISAELPKLAQRAELKNLLDTAPPVIHLLGLYSTGGVHSHAKHLRELITQIRSLTKTAIMLHLFSDGRDTGSSSALDEFKKLEAELAEIDNCQIGSVCGRFFAMDRDSRWQRTEEAFRAITGEASHSTSSASEWISFCYENGITDEFIKPCSISNSISSGIKAQDAVICFNFRADRMRQLCKAFVLDEFEHFQRPFVLERSHILGFTNYDPSLQIPFLFAPLKVDNHLGEIISNKGLRQLRVAETEKYPHVTYFFNGGVEASLKGEERFMAPSPRDVKTYDLKPEMSAEQVTTKVVEAIEQDSFDFIVLNYANGDMVGHTGVLSAAIKAVETVDRCLARILKTLKDKNGQALIIADHGNCEQMENYESGAPHTAHTTYPVPVFLVSEDLKVELNNGALIDVAPTILKMMEIEQPQEMTGKALF